jgi:ribulose 1,5-bisphosphate carboxylase large subunit-like protein
MQGHQEPSDQPLQQEKPLNQESVESLLKYLIYIVLHKEENDDVADETKQSLLDLLKSDENLREQLFGQLAQQGKQQ